MSVFSVSVAVRRVRREVPRLTCTLRYRHYTMLDLPCLDPSATSDNCLSVVERAGAPDTQAREACKTNERHDTHDRTQLPASQARRTPPHTCGVGTESEKRSEGLRCGTTDMQPMTRVAARMPELDSNAHIYRCIQITVSAPPRPIKIKNCTNQIVISTCIRVSRTGHTRARAGTAQ